MSILADWSVMGGQMPKARFCVDHGITTTTLDTWVRRRSEQPALPSPDAAAELHTASGIMDEIYRHRSRITELKAKLGPILADQAVGSL